MLPFSETVLLAICWNMGVMGQLVAGDKKGGMFEKKENFGEFLELKGK